MIKNEKLLEMLKDGKLDKLETSLLDNIREEIAKGNGNQSKLTIIKKVIKSAKKNNPNLCGAIDFELDNVKYQGYTEGYRILASVEKFGFDLAKNQLKMADMFRQDNSFCYEVNIADLKLFVKTNKEKAYVIKDDRIKESTTKSGGILGINASYLLDSLTFCNTNKIYITNRIAPVLIKGFENREISIVLPININD